jgi:hypothetical protein
MPSIANYTFIYKYKMSKTIVIMPGGFHPPHSGHMSLYNSARRAFPDAEVYVAATNDTSSRPFPFAVKEKLAQLAGVEPGHFVQVKSPFRAEEITARFDPARDQLIFVRSEKDAKSQPLPGGVKKDGSPSYLQPLLGAKRLEPFARHAYMAYLPTVEFGPGMKSATEIRAAWPQLDDRRKTALVMSLYPKTQSNPKLAATVVKMLDTAIGSTVDENQGWAATYTNEGNKNKNYEADPELKQSKLFAKQHYSQHTNDPDMAFDKWVQRSLMHSKQDDVQQNEILKRLTQKVDILARRLQQAQLPVGENAGQMAGTPAVGGMWAGYQQRENQPGDEDYVEDKWSAKYKSSINCANPKGFSQRAHCAGRKK